MPMHRFALSAILTAVALMTVNSGASAQTRDQPRLGAPPASRGVVGGLPDDDPTLTLAQLAAESNQWAPCCEPPSPTKGLWEGCPSSCQFPSWQECWMLCRDGLGWVFTRPVCSCDVTLASDASAWDWLTQWMPRLGSVSSGVAPCSLCP
jgi:hypothetical protein